MIFCLKTPSMISGGSHSSASQRPRPITLFYLLTCYLILIAFIQSIKCSKNSLFCTWPAFLSQDWQDNNFICHFVSKKVKISWHTKESYQGTSFCKKKCQQQKWQTWMTILRNLWSHWSLCLQNNLEMMLNKRKYQNLSIPICF